MPVYVNRAHVATTTTGAGTITLGTAVPGFQTFGAAGLVDGDVVSYTIEDEGNAWEVGTGTYSSTGPTLTRTLVQSSTGALLNLTGAARVYVIASADNMANLKLANGTAALPSVSFNSDPDTGVFDAGANTLGLSTGGSERMRIDSSGNVGIGTSSPGAPLEIAATSLTNALIVGSRGTNTSSALAFFSNGNIGSGMNMSNRDGLDVRLPWSGGGNTVTGLSVESFAGTFPALNNVQILLGTSNTGSSRRAAVAYVGADNALTFRTGATDAHPGQTLSGTERMRIDGAGNVGIGTSTPAVRAHVQSTDAGTNAVLDVLRLDRQSSGTPAAGIGVGMEFATETSVGNTEIGATIEAITTDVTAGSEDFDLVFRTMSGGAAAAERMRVTSTGAVRANTFLDAAGGNTATINGITPALASQAEAQAGTDNTKLMTPLRVAQAVSAAVDGVSLGTLTTTSGTTQTLSGLDLTEYNSLRIFANGVSHSSGTSQALTISGAIISSAAGSSGIFYGSHWVDLSTGAGKIGITSNPPTILRKSSTSISFSWSAGASFDAGSITVYGVA